MATTQMWYLDQKALEEEATKIKNVVITFLRNEDYIADDVYNDISLNYAFIVKKPSFFSKLWTRKNVAQNLQYILVKQLTLTENDEPKKDPKANLIVITSNKEKKE